MQAAQFRDDFIARAQREVISIAEHDLHAYVFELAGRETLDASVRADRHEDRRFDAAVCRVQAAPPSLAIGVQKFKSEAHAGIVGIFTDRSRILANATTKQAIW